MYISQLKIKNFRIFQDNEINFNERLNVIIGPNNCGKTTILSALEILFGSTSSRKLNAYDFNKNIDLEDLKCHSPEISISATITQSHDQSEITDEVIPIATWLTKIEPPFEAKLTYRFFLPERDEEEYKKLISEFDIDNYDDYWTFLDNYFIKKYIYKLYVGHDYLNNTVDRDDLSKFDFQFLSAIRDVEKDLTSGKKSLLKDILEFFTDYNLINSENRRNEIRENKKIFAQKSEELYKELYERMKDGKKEILKYIENTGASFDNITPDFIGKFTEKEAYEHMFLITEDKYVKLPIKLNGLGYNNLLYISLILAKIQKDSSPEEYGENTKLYSILAIEEPEAHLHPNMQYKFLKFLKENQENEVNQIFITSHSPNITAAVDLENLVILDKHNTNITTYYPAHAFEDDALKRYVERFLDVTKSDIFFAKKLIFVEGLAEQILIPEFVKLMNENLSDYHISIINLNGRYFKPFIELFNPNTGINKEVLCITDRDSKKNLNGHWNACYIYEVDEEDDENYSSCSNDTVNDYENKYKNINVKTQEYGNTFEYELMFSNPTYVDLIIDPMHNKNTIKEMISKFKENNEKYDEIFKLIRSKKRQKLFEDNILNNTSLDDSDKSRHMISTMFIESIKSKGEYSQNLAETILDFDETEFNIPHYIKEGLKWIMELEP